MALSSCRGLHRLGRLGEVGAHVSLQVEIRKLLALVNLKEGRKLAIRDDLSAIGLILKIIRSDVGVDVAGDLSSGHLRAHLLSQKLGELVTNSGRLHEPAGSTVAGLSLSLGGRLLRILELAIILLVQSAVIRLQRSNNRAELLQLGKNVKGLLIHTGINFTNNLLYSRSGSRSSNSGGGSRGNRSSNRCSSSSSSLNSRSSGSLLLGLSNLLHLCGNLLDNRGGDNRDRGNNGSRGGSGGGGSSFGGFGLL
jgi:hypothetical protein